MLVISTLAWLQLCANLALSSPPITTRRPMGASANCDSGKSVAIDFDTKNKTLFTCSASELAMFQKNQEQQSFVFQEALNMTEKSPTHICINKHIYYDEALPASGAHRPVWPTYGTYKYLPVQRWVHSLEHGAAVFLYHPCTSKENVAQLQKLANSCLYRHVITPSRRFANPKKLSMAVITWQNLLQFSTLSTEKARSKVRSFVKANALRGPEKAPLDGSYKFGLIRPSKILPGSDKLDSAGACP